MDPLEAPEAPVKKTYDPYEGWKALMRAVGLNDKLEGTPWENCDQLPIKINPGAHGKGLAEKVGSALEYAKGWGFPRKAMFELPLAPEVVLHRFVTLCELALSLSGDLHLTLGNLNEALKKSRTDDWYRRMNNLSPTADVAEHKNAPAVTATGTAAIMSKLDTLQAESERIGAELAREQEANLKLDDKVAEHGLIIRSTVKQVAESRETLHEFVNSSKKAKGVKGQPRPDPETPTRPSRRVRYASAAMDEPIGRGDLTPSSSSSAAAGIPLAPLIISRTRRGGGGVISGPSRLFRATKAPAAQQGEAKGVESGDDTSPSDDEDAFVSCDEPAQGTSKLDESMLRRLVDCSIGERGREPEPGPSSGRSFLRQRGAPSPPSSSSSLYPYLADTMPRRPARECEPEPEPASPSSSSSSSLSPPGSDARSRKTWRRRRRSSTVGNDQMLRRHIRRYAMYEANADMDAPAS